MAVFGVLSMTFGDFDLLRVRGLDPRPVALLEPSAHPDAAVLELFRLHSGGGKGAFMTKVELVRQMSEHLRREFVGVDFNFSQYIQDNIEEAVSGVKGENSVKIFGRDLNELERLSKSLKSEIATVRGVTNPGGFKLLRQPNLVIKINREKAARYGFSVGDVNAVVQAAIGGQEVTRVYEGEMNFALTVRFAPEYRRNIDTIRSIPVALPNNDPKAPTAYIALGELGEVKLETGAAYIYRENSQRFVPLKYSVRGRDLGSTVADAQQVIAEKVPLPPSYRMEWTGEFGAMVDAQKRLAVIVPLSLLLIMMLLYSLFNSIRDSLLALSGIPFAVAGGILGLYVAGLNFSISAAIGFISLFGVSSMDGILLVSYIRKNLEEGLPRDEAIVLAGETRMSCQSSRPALNSSKPAMMTKSSQRPRMADTIAAASIM